jgi:hypothetical protein
MPYTEKQHRFFQAIAHGFKPDRVKGPSREEAKKMAAEGVKKGSKAAALERAMGKRNHG